jgi:hypothetical protein
MLSSCKNALGKVPPAQRLRPTLLLLRGKPPGSVLLSKPDPIAEMRKLELSVSGDRLWDGTGELRWLVHAGCGTN